MKRVVSLALSLLLLCLCCLGVLAEGPWSEDYYRASAPSGMLSDAEQDSLDKECIAFMEQYRVDLVLLAADETDRRGMTLEQASKEYYESCGFGYGETHDGFLWVYDMDEEAVTLFCFGAAEGMISQDYVDRATASAAELEQEHGVFGVLYGGVRYLSLYLDEHGTQRDADAPAEAGPEAAGPEAAGPALPSWYPEDPEHFAFFHDENAPRVVDRAGILGGETERLEQRLAEIRQETGRDVVVYTDVTAYGREHSVLAADFYDYNGYGVGDEREGVCLFVCMDPADRGWWVCCTGPATRGLYTEDAANLLDDALYGYLSAGDYAAGVADWAENLRVLCKKGLPFAPDWYPDLGTEFVRFHNTDAPRVVDDAGMLSASEIAELEARAAEIAGAYRLDVGIHTAPEPVALSRTQYAEDYYRYNGYGLGENYDGIFLTVYRGSGDRAGTRLTVSGAGAAKLTETNENRLREYCEDAVNNGQTFEGLRRWLDNVEHMERTGRVPRTALYWILTALAGSALGSAVGGIALAGAKRRMRTPQPKTEANRYVLSDTSRITGAGAAYLYSTSSRHYIPPAESSRSSGSSGRRSSGRSSYSGSYSGSSGSSHSGSGRRF